MINLSQEPQALGTLERIGDWRFPAGGNTTQAGPWSRGRYSTARVLQPQHQLKCFRSLHDSSTGDFTCVTEWKLKKMRVRIWHLNLPSQAINISPPFPSNIPSPLSSSSSFSSSGLHPSRSLFSMDDWWYSRGIAEQENFPGHVASSRQIKEHVQTTSI